jgi:hypothetical protein
MKDHICHIWQYDIITINNIHKKTFSDIAYLDNLNYSNFKIHQSTIRTKHWQKLTNVVDGYILQFCY